MLRPWLARSLLSCCVFALSTTLRAQGVDLRDQSPPVEPEELSEDSLPPTESEPVLPSSEPSVPSFVNAQEAATPVSPTPRRFQYRLRVELRAAYDDNVTLSDTDPVDDYLFVIEPTISLGFGDITSRQDNFLGIEYSPSLYLYADHSDFNSLNHIVRIEGRYRFSRLTIGLIQDIQSVQSSDVNSAASAGNIVSRANLDIGGRQRLNAFGTHIPMSYDLSGKTSLTASIDYTFTDYSGSLINSAVISGNVGFNYAYSPKLVIGLDATGGENFVDAPSPNESFEQMHVRMSYELTGKLRASGAAGVEFRQFDSGQGENVTPVFEIAVNYQPFDGTAIDLTATRQTLSSASLSGQDYTSSQVILTLQQRFFQRIFVNVSGGYQQQDYFSTVDGVSSTREDNYYFIAPGFDVRITNFFFAGLYYLHRQNDSSTSSFSFDENQFGARAILNF